MPETSESDDSSSTEPAEPVKVDEPQEDVVEKDAGEKQPSQGDANLTTVSVDPPEEDRVEFSQHDDPDSTLVHTNEDKSADDSSPSEEEPSSDE